MSLLGLNAVQPSIDQKLLPSDNCLLGYAK